MPKSLEEINERIRDGSVYVVTADEMTAIVGELGSEDAAREVDVVTTGTFGAMCSSGVWMNFGHSDPPIKMSQVWLNDVEAYTGVAAVDAFIGATQLSETRGLEVRRCTRYRRSCGPQRSPFEGCWLCQRLLSAPQRRGLYLHSGPQRSDDVESA